MQMERIRIVERMANPTKSDTERKSFVCLFGPVGLLTASRNSFSVNFFMAQL